MKWYYYELLNAQYDDLGACIPDGWHKSTAINQAKAWMRENGVRHANLSVNSMRTSNILDIIEITL
jgi:hypothetical protein